MALPPFSCLPLRHDFIPIPLPRIRPICLSPFTNTLDLLDLRGSLSQNPDLPRALGGRVSSTSGVTRSSWGDRDTNWRNPSEAGEVTSALGIPPTAWGLDLTITQAPTRVPHACSHWNQLTSAHSHTHPRSGRAAQASVIWPIALELCYLVDLLEAWSSKTSKHRHHTSKHGKDGLVAPAGPIAPGPINGIHLDFSVK